ncbi:hypothetical protein MYU51_016043 [Penicillium brevicompactum]|uniref:Winged helix-turn-helix transcription repressor DNA-binding n=1 Tax=Penicillium brevicompactum TaxID=5074 RepID=UPI002540E1A2|nr:Winged helix-turn-helix transcription repressor DNA-binding [Penicillium brevicompactum]KAJ5342955.1 Winged helix-turn-helix transcription repressor DNA-binding [Penicillium brevicompactum]
MASPSFRPFELDEQTVSVQEYIENALMALVHELSLPASEAHLSISLKRRANPACCFINPITGALDGGSRVESMRTYSWPGKTLYEEWKFAVILRIMSILLDAIRTGQLISKRDIYYIEPEFFRAQYIVNNIIDDLACTIGVNRGALNVEAAGKGLVAGNFRLIRESQVVLNAQSPTEDTLIPRLKNGDEIDISRIRWVMVIEKEAVFHRLARSGYHIRATAGEGILVTGKGYPDLSTRAFLRKLYDVASTRPTPLRFYALTDGDPHGMAIMSTYKYGSVAQLHENARLSLPRLQWLGLRVSDIVAVPDEFGDKALCPLTKRDRNKILAMLQNSPVWASDGPEPQWRVELQRMLMLNFKAEIEVLYEHTGGLEGWIDRRMFRQE